MKEMIYQQLRKRELLARDTYKGYEYFVISLGTHPCAYVKLNGESLSMVENLPCHGGVTYTEAYLKLPDETLEGEFVGWDYAHWGDRWGDEGGEEYSTSELVTDCEQFIEELIENKGDEE